MVEQKQYKNSLNNLTNKIGDKDVSSFSLIQVLAGAAEEGALEREVREREEHD